MKPYLTSTWSSEFRLLNPSPDLKSRRVGSPFQERTMKNNEITKNAPYKSTQNKARFCEARYP